MTTLQKTFSSRVVIQMLFFVVLIPCLPLLISWRWDWWEAWVTALVCISGFAVSRLIAARKNPDLIAERAKFLQHPDAKSWDKVLAPLVGLGSGLILVVSGLDGLFRWSPVFSLPVKLVALAVIVAGFTIGSYALIENRFFSGMVRLQTDRGQYVISTGPYAWVRHPGYASSIFTYLALPIFLDAVWALLPAVFFLVIMVIRTRLEDQTLQAELPGYAEYAHQVRYRLLPGVW